MSKFRRRPVEIEAVRFINQPTEIAGTEPEWYLIARTIDADEVGSITYHQLKGSDFGVLHIHTLEGVMRSEPGDWIIRGIEGELYSCKSGIFEKTYEEVAS